MLDARYLAFASVSALLVISPGATLAVVMETAIGEGRAAALFTVLGVGLGNATLALASALGMSAVLHRWPAALELVKMSGAAYLTYLGLRGVWFGLRGRALAPAAGRPDRKSHAASSAAALVARGATTNLLNPPVILFYMTLLPQFIGPQDPFFARFLVLGGTHVAMSVIWQSSCGLAVGAIAERMARPAVRRALEAATGAVLVGLGLRLVLR